MFYILEDENNVDLSISTLINQFIQGISLKFNDGASNFNNGAENLMREHFN